MNPMGISLWSIEGVPIKVTWVKMIWPNTIKWMESMRNEWIEVSRMNGWKWTRTTLWEWSYEWIERYPMEVTWCEWKSMSLSKWSESMRNELEWDRISEMRWNEWFDGKARRKSLWVEGEPMEPMEGSWIEFVWNWKDWMRNEWNEWDEP